MNASQTTSARKHRAARGRRQPPLSDVEAPAVASAGHPALSAPAQALVRAGLCETCASVEAAMGPHEAERVAIARAEWMQAIPPPQQQGLWDG